MISIKNSQALVVFLVAIFVSACASNLQTKVSGHLNSLSKHQTVAILPVEASDTGQKEMADMFRQGLYANLKQSKFQLLEKFIVDGLLKQNNLTDPAKFLNINPMQFGEILGADAIIFSRINKVERTYFIVHSSIELSVSVQMVDTRTGEILWRAEQTEHDFSGIGKIPTGIVTALFAPIQFVTNKFNLSKMTSKMVDKLTALVKKPENAEENTKFDKLVIAKNATTDLNKIKELQQLKAEWAQALVMNEELESDTLAHSLPATSPTVGTIQNQVPLKARVRKVQAVESEMIALSHSTKAKEQKPETSIALNTLKTTLATPISAEEPATIKAKTRKQPTHSKPFYTVQVGAYKTEAYAQSLLIKLEKKGYNAFVSHKDTKIYRVQVDKFSFKADALKLSQKLKNSENLKNFVTRITAG